MPILHIAGCVGVYEIFARNQLMSLHNNHYATLRIEMVKAPHLRLTQSSIRRAAPAAVEVAAQIVAEAG